MNHSQSLMSKTLINESLIKLVKVFHHQTFALYGITTVIPCQSKMNPWINKMELQGV